MTAKLAGPAAGTADSSVLSDAHVPHVAVCLDGPVLADKPSQVLRSGVSAGQAGNGVDGLAGGLAGGGALAPAGDLDGLAGVRKVQAADVICLQGAGLDTAVPGLADGEAGRTCRQGKGPNPGMQSG